MRGVVWVADLQGPGVDRRAGRASWSPGDLVGRERECALLDALLSTVAERGAALVLWGEPGVGKTALLEYAARTTSADVLKAQGVESEAVLPFATLADVLLPLREHFRDLPRVQREALEACLALSGRASTNPYAVCVGAMNVLAAAGELRPVVVLVDDMQWVDPSSQRVLLFTARRLACERVAIVLTVREDKGELGAYASLPSIEVSGLSRPACAELLRSHDLDVAPAVLDDLAGTSGGNPLALLETASSLSAAQLRGEQPITQLPTLGRHLERAWSSRIRELPEATRNALAVVAASRFSTIRTIETALAAIGLSLADLSPAEEAGLITAIGDGYRFRHPILRPLVLQRTPLAQRLHAFHALAEVSSGTLRAWYLAAATTGPDNEVAQTLVEAALDARRRSGFEAAALAWRRAADLTPEGPIRADRLRLAATDAFLGGSSLDAAAWCDDALRITTDPVVCADINLLRGRIYTWIGQPSRAHQLLVEAARSIRDVDPPRACALLAEAALPAALDAKLAAALRIAEEASALAARSATSSVPSSVVLGSSLILVGRVSEGRAQLEAARDAIEAADPVREQQLLALAGQCWGWADNPGEARRLLTAVVEAARRNSAPAALPFALAARSEIETWAGRWAAAYADATESLRWSEELGQISCMGYSLACLARLDAVRGDRARCEERIARARCEVGPFSIGCLEPYLTNALGAAALAYGEYDAAIEHLETNFEYARRVGLDNPNVVPFAADLAEAHFRAGNNAHGAVVLAWLKERAEATGLTWPTAAAGRCLALLAPSVDDAEAQFDAAEAAHLRCEMPFEHARTRLCRGEVLRRFRRTAAARIPLVAALATFQSLGARPWVNRTAAELAATGQRPPYRTAAGALNHLTPQELQVARAIVSGMNNIEAASALFVSRKTVEAHLTRVYRKLGVRSRTDLTRVLVSEGLKD